MAIGRRPTGGHQRPCRPVQPRHRLGCRVDSGVVEPGVPRLVQAAVALDVLVRRVVELEGRRLVDRRDDWRRARGVLTTRAMALDRCTSSPLTAPGIRAASRHSWPRWRPRDIDSNWGDEVSAAGPARLGIEVVRVAGCASSPLTDSRPAQAVDLGNAISRRAGLDSVSPYSTSGSYSATARRHASRSKPSTRTTSMPSRAGPAAAGRHCRRRPGAPRRECHRCAAA